MTNEQCPVCGGKYRYHYGSEMMPDESYCAHCGFWWSESFHESEWHSARAYRRNWRLYKARKKSRKAIAPERI